MATIVGTPTQFSATKVVGTTTYTVLFTPDGVTGTPRPAGAGNKLVLCAFGGATVTAKITNSSGAAFTSRGQAASTQAVSIHEFTAVGGETAVFVTLNGAENVSIVVHEFSGLGAFIAASTGTPTTAVANDWQSKPAALALGANSNAMLVAAFAVTATAAVAPFGVANQWRQMGPLGRLVTNFGNQPGANSQYLAATGVADVTNASSYPPNLAAGSYQATSVWNQNGAQTWCVQVAYADTSGVPTNPAPANPVAAENSLPGTAQANWFLGTTSGTNANIAGYTDKTSYQPGDTVGFKVDSGNGAFRAEVYRLGWYGWDDMGARNVLGNQSGYIVGTPVVQPAPTVDGTLGSTSCAWTTNATWTIPAGAAPGVYYVVFRSTVTPANAASGHFVVRPASVAGKIVSVVPDTTYQAYNVWGGPGDNGLFPGVWTGRSLYQAGQDGSTSNFAHRAYAVSFDRPYGIQSTQPNTYMFDSEYGLLQMTEAQGYDLTYLSSVDLDNNPSILTAAKLVIMSGHHEYWTTGIYDAFTAAADAGVNMLVASSNTALWRTRFAAGDTNKRTMICYKDSGTADRSAGFTGTGYDPGGYTGTWRDTRTNPGTVNNTDVRRENALTGQLFRVNAPANTQLTVPYAQKNLPMWRNSAAIQALTAGQVYTTPTSVIGDEADLPDGSTGQPTNMVLLSPTAVSWASQGTNAAGSTYAAAVSGTASFTLYRRASGALVFNTGSWRGFQGVSRWAQSKLSGSVVTTPDTNWQNALLSMLYDLGATPAAIRALRPGIDTAPTDPAVGAPIGGRSGVALTYGLRAPEDGNANVFFA